MKLVYLFIVLALAFSCSSSSKKMEDVSQVYQSSGYEKYLMPAVPSWLNYSAGSNCFRSSPIKYLNVKNIRDSYYLSYEQAVQLQYSFNITSSLESGLSVSQEENLFFRASEAILANFKEFKVPNTSGINLVLIDSFLSEIDKLKSILATDYFDEAPAIFVSLCLNHSELKNFLQDNSLYSYSGIFLSSEILSPFDPNGNLVTGRYLYVHDFFGIDKDIYLISNWQKPVEEFVGKVEILDLRKILKSKEDDESNNDTDKNIEENFYEQN